MSDDTKPTREQLLAQSAIAIEFLTALLDDALQAIPLLTRCLFPVELTAAQQECIGEPMADDDVALYFMGSGGSDCVTMGDIRKALAAAHKVLATAEHFAPYFEQSRTHRLRDVVARASTPDDVSPPHEGGVDA